MNAIVAQSFFQKVSSKVATVYEKIDLLAPISNLIIRLWVANVFWKSGMTKISTWDSTIYLFENEYAVPFLSPEIAAYLATAAELSLPILLALGLAGRPSAFALFIFNIVAVISYPDLNPPGVEDHQVWGIMLLVPLLYGPGKLSLDYLITKKFGR